MLHRLFIAVALAALCVSSAAAQSGPATASETSKVHAAASGIALGTPVGVALHDGQRLTGVLLDVGERGLIIQPAPSAEPEMIEYARVDAITERSTWYPSLSSPTTMGFGAVFGLLIAAFVAVGWRMRNRRPA